MRPILLERLNNQKKISGKSLEAISKITGYSDSTLSRWYKGESTPDTDQLENVYVATGGSLKDLYAEVGEAEVKAAEKFDYKGTDALLAEFEKREALYKHHCEQVVAHERSLREQQQQSFDKAIQALRDSQTETVSNIKESYKASTDYLKSQNGRLRTSLIVISVLFVVAVVSLTVYILIDAPQIGAGW